MNTRLLSRTWPWLVWTSVLTPTLALSCTPKPSPDGTEDSPPPDTAHTAVDSDSGESADTPHSGDSGETGETADTGTPSAPWQPGADIPGWEDFDCTDPVGGRVFETTFPDTFQIVGEFLPEQMSVGPHRLEVRLRDCEFFPCAETDTDVDRTLPFVAATLDGTWGEDPELLGLGWWGPDDSTDPRHVEAEGNGPLVGWSNGTHGNIGSASACLERMRPDGIRGVVRIELPVPFGDTPVYYYDTIVFRFPFQVRLADHAGFDTTRPDTGTAPDGYATAHFLYDIPYEDAWPWDSITDPAVRAQVQERYTPYNAE